MRRSEPLIMVADACIQTDGGRTLVEGLRLSMAREHVALVGRNGVGKSTLLSVLAGSTPHERVTRRCSTHIVPQTLASADAGMSPGELRKLRLIEARRSGADVLFLDEPTSDLDDAAVAWLRAWLPSYPGGVVLASHDRRLLSDMRHFFWIREAGCRYFGGTLEELDLEQAREESQSEQRYLRSMNDLAVQEERTLHLTRRKARKKQYGRSRELARCTSRARLNQKRSDAQVSHGKAALTRQARLDAVRSFAKSTRRALTVRLPLVLTMPPRASPGATQETQRLAVVGPNGAGKTTLLQAMLRTRDLSMVGEISQGGANWLKEESLLSELAAHMPDASPERLAQVLAAHRFPLGLAERRMCSLSPGERVRAALICLFVRTPAVDVLVLDEPTFSLDQLGRNALIQALRAWPRELWVATHDSDVLAEVGFDRVITLGGSPDSAHEAVLTKSGRGWSPRC